MAHKRKAVEAFAKPSGQLSAFAAARLARHPKQIDAEPEGTQRPRSAHISASDVAAIPYDGRASHLEETEAVANIVSEILASPPSFGLLVTLTTARLEDVATSSPDGSQTDIRLHSGQHITVVGEYDIEVIRGAVSLYGGFLHPGSRAHCVYAPSTHALPQIVARADDTVLNISSVRSGLRKLEKLSPLFRNIWSESQRPSFHLLGTSADDAFQRSLIPLQIEKPLQAVLSYIAAQAESNARNTRVMAIGAKSSGKSTFNRLLCNTIITRPKATKCFYLDLDPGQPEFGPPGMVSLVEVTSPVLGPPFTHPASSQSRQYRVLRSHAIAATTFRDDTAHFRDCAVDLARYADRQYPLIVNSCGWVSGLGASVLLDLVLSLSISDVVVLDPVEAGFIESLQQTCADATIHRLSRQASRPSSRTPAESRNMQTMAYMHQKISLTKHLAKWSSSPISSTRPWTVNYAGGEGDIYTIMSYGQEPSPEYLGEVLDGSLVAIVTCDESSLPEAFGLHDTAHPAASSAASTPGDLIQRTAEGLPYIVPPGHQGWCTPLNPSYTQCVGLALIRGIDTAARQLQLVTPLSEPDIAALMQKKVVLVRGSFDPPTWAYLEDVYSSEEQSSGSAVRPWVSKKDMVGIEGAVWRLRHPPMASAVAPR